MFGFDPGAGIALASIALALPFVLHAARAIDWPRLGVHDHAAWALLTALVLVGHRMAIELPGGVSLHYQGAAFLAILLGWSRAVLSMLVICVTEAVLESRYGSLGLRLLVGGIFPIWTMLFLIGLTQRLLPRNLFVFLLGCGFFGLYLVNALQFALGLALTAAMGSDATVDVLAYGLLLASGEVIIEGMLITVFVVYVPWIVRTFDDAFYLGRPDPRR